MAADKCDWGTCEADIQAYSDCVEKEEAEVCPGLCTRELGFDVLKFPGFPALALN